MTIQFIDDDFVTVRREPKTSADSIVILVFGDSVEAHETKHGWTRVTVHGYFDGPFDGHVKGEPALRDHGVLKFSMVDVQQGDGMVVETPSGKILLIDGGDNKLFARHLAARFRHRGWSAEQPLEIDGMLVTHGDADHFSGLNDIRQSEKLSGDDRRKRVFIHPRRVLHNGLVKGPSALPERAQLGRTVEQDGRLLAVDLYDDPRDAPEAAQNQHFERWGQTLDHWQSRGPIDIRRLAYGMDESQLFDFLHDDGVTVELWGPCTTEARDPASGETRAALPFLSAARRSARMHLDDEPDDKPGDKPGDKPDDKKAGGSPSTSHTINGHSVALRMTYGNVRFNLTGDLNKEGMEQLLQRVGENNLEAEIVKIPHHGSADFDFRTLAAMRPVVALISSGDEDSEWKEYIHPRATLMAAVGKVMRGDMGVVLCTELAAFFNAQDECYTREDLAKFFKDRKDEVFTGEQLRQLFTGKPRKEDPRGMFFGFERKNFGIIHVRTDGERVLVFTLSGKEPLREAYRFTVTMKDGERVIEFADEVRGR